MTKAEKKRFARELISSVRKLILGKIEDVPEEWDGIELRQLIADTFDIQARSLSMRQDKKRLKDYRNECLIRNLV